MKKNISHILINILRQNLSNIHFSDYISIIIIKRRVFLLLFLAHISITSYLLKNTVRECSVSHQLRLDKKTCNIVQRRVPLKRYYTEYSREEMLLWNSRILSSTYVLIGMVPIWSRFDTDFIEILDDMSSAIEEPLITNCHA